MAAAGVTNLAAILKTIWPQSDVVDLFFDEAPLFAMLPKRTDWAGNVETVVVQFGQVNGRSASYQRAKANVGQSKFTSMQVTTSDNYAVWQVERKLMVLSRNDKGSVVRAIERETKSAMKKFKRSLAYMIYGNGGGSIGQIASTTVLTGNVLTFVNSQSLRQVDVGDFLNFSVDDGTGGGGIRSGTNLQVTGVNPELQQVTLSGNLNTITSITTSDYVFIDGDYALAMYGLSSYVPSVTPTTSLWGMNRTNSPRRLGGIRVSGKGLLIQEAVKKALKVAKDEGASISHIFMSTTDFLNLELALGTAVRYTDEKVSANVGFSGIQFTYGGSKPVKVFLDADCPQGLVYGLQLDTWTLHSAGEYPDFLTMDGSKYDYLQDSTLSVPTFEGRIGGYAQLYTDAPGFNFVLTLNS